MTPQNRLLARQLALSEQMRREGKHLLSGKEYKPALTKPAPVEKPPKADKVVIPFKKGKGKP